MHRWQADQSENNVLMALLLALWRWLLPASDRPASRPSVPGAPPAAAFAACAAHAPLAPHPMPLPRLLS